MTYSHDKLLYDRIMYELDMLQMKVRIIEPGVELANWIADVKKMVMTYRRVMKGEKE